MLHWFDNIKGNRRKREAEVGTEETELLAALDWWNTEITKGGSRPTYSIMGYPIKDIYNLWLHDPYNHVSNLMFAMNYRVGPQSGKRKSPFNYQHKLQQLVIDSQKEDQLITVKGYKSFPSDLVCRDIQYVEGEEHVFEGVIKPCQSGLHFCLKAEDTLHYYNHFHTEGLRIFEVEAQMYKSMYHGEAKKLVARSLKMGREITREEMEEAARARYLSKDGWMRIDYPDILGIQALAEITDDELIEWILDSGVDMTPRLNETMTRKFVRPFTPSFLTDKMMDELLVDIKWSLWKAKRFVIKELDNIDISNDQKMILMLAMLDYKDIRV